MRVVVQVADDVNLTVFIKNVSTLVIKVSCCYLLRVFSLASCCQLFRINARSYYKSNLKEVRSEQLVHLHQLISLFPGRSMQQSILMA